MGSSTHCDTSIDDFNHLDFGTKSPFFTPGRVCLATNLNTRTCFNLCSCIILRITELFFYENVTNLHSTNAFLFISFGSKYDFCIAVNKKQKLNCR